jgi:hypothetical protein
MPLVTIPIPLARRGGGGGSGSITIAGRVFRGNVETKMSHFFFMAGSQDAGHNCARDTLYLSDGGGKQDYQSAQAVLD